MVYIAQTGETGLMCYKIWKAGTLLKKVCDFPVRNVTTKLSWRGLV
jgi:hypothetical protein